MLCSTALDGVLHRMSPVQPALTTASMPVFPTMGSLQEVVDYADSQLPITSKNDICALLFIYHNTLLKLLQTPK